MKEDWKKGSHFLAIRQASWVYFFLAMTLSFFGQQRSQMSSCGTAFEWLQTISSRMPSLLCKERQVLTVWNLALGLSKAQNNWTLHSAHDRRQQHLPHQTPRAKETTSGAITSTQRKVKVKFGSCMSFGTQANKSVNGFARNVFVCFLWFLTKNALLTKQFVLVRQSQWHCGKLQTLLYSNRRLKLTTACIWFQSLDSKEPCVM